MRKALAILATTLPVLGCLQPVGVPDDLDGSRAATSDAALVTPGDAGDVADATFVESAGDAGPAPCPRGGSCSIDDDCVVAYCASGPCGGCFHYALAKSLLNENVCLVEIGGVDGPTTGAPPACYSGGYCGCPAHPLCTPHCLSGTCGCLSLDGGY
jgi:hypothetical protein